MNGARVLREARQNRWRMCLQQLGNAYRPVFGPGNSKGQPDCPEFTMGRRVCQMFSLVISGLLGCRLRTIL